MISNLYAYPNHDNMKMKRINELHCRAEEPTMTLDGWFFGYYSFNELFVLRFLLQMQTFGMVSLRGKRKN